MAASRCSGNAKPRAEAGFSLLELMIALAIFVTSIGVLLTAQMAASRHEAHARNVFTATALARDLYTKTVVFGNASMLEEKGDFGTAYPQFTWKRKASDAIINASLSMLNSTLGNQAANMGVNLGGFATILPNLKEIHLNVEWEERGDIQTTEIVFFQVEP